MLKINVTSVLTKDYENEPRLRIPGKQSQYKAKQTQFQTHRRPENTPNLSCGEDIRPVSRFFRRASRHRQIRSR